MKFKIYWGLAIYASLTLLQAQPADIREGLVSYWPLDSTPDGSTTPDVASNGNHLNLVNMTSANFVAGVRGNAASFDGASQLLYYTYTAGADNGLPVYNARYYTVAMWVRDSKYATGTNQLSRAVFAEASSTANNPLFALRTDTTAANRTNLLAAILRNDNNNTFFGGTASFADPGKSTLMPFDGAWHHIAWVDNNGTARLYVDGQLDPHVFKNTRVSEPEQVAVASRGLTLDTLAIGAIQQAGVSNYFNGLIDDVAVWERALTQAEIDEVRTNGIATPIAAAAPSVTNSPAGDTNLLVGQSFALQALGLGAHPRTYQWLKDGAVLMDLVETNELGEITNSPITGTTSSILVLTNLQTSYSGAYSVIISNNYGSVTSSVADLLVSAVSPQAPNLTNGQIAYWPLDAIQGITTPEVVRGYDMLLGTGLGSGNIVPGKWGNAFKFNSNGILSRVHSTGDALPISQYLNFTVSVWINASTNKAGQRYFAEGNLTSGNPWLSLGQVDNATQAAGVNPEAPLSSVRGFMRNDANQNDSSAGVSASSVFYDPFVQPGGAWHHVVYIQEEVGGAVPLLTGRLYVDGVRDTGFVGSPRLPRSEQNSSIGGALRTGITGQFGDGMIDDVAVWNRALTDLEILMLSTNVTPAAPPVLSPLQITSFRADFPEVVSGDAITLRWAVSSSAAAIDIDQGVGSVLSRSTNGFGSLTISNVTSSTTYTLTIQRGITTVTALTSVRVVNGVAAGWNILDDFETYSVGALVNPYWSDFNGGSSIEVIGGNHMLNTPSGGGQLALLPLSGFTLNEGQACTIFARIYIQDDPGATLMLNEIGPTDKSLRSPNDADSDVGPIVRLNADSGGQLAIGARNGAVVPANPITLIPRKLEYQQVYNLWLDVTNGPFVTSIDATNTGDTFSIWLQRLGESNRILIASNYTTDRDLELDFLGATGLHLTQLVVGNDGGSTGTIYVDDLYISKSGYNSTVPVAWTTPVPPAVSVPTLTADTTSTPGQIQFIWNAGALMSAPTVIGPWTVIPDSYGFSYGVIIDQATPQQYYLIQR
jgi:hypothetical protein